MSQEAAKVFIERMKTDDAFRTKIMAVSDVKERIKLINAEGFACGAEEIQAQGKVLEDSEVDLIKGGSSETWWSGLIDFILCPEKA